MKCVLKDMGMMSDFFVNMTTRIWNGTFAAVSIDRQIHLFLIIYMLASPPL